MLYRLEGCDSGGDYNSVLVDNLNREMLVSSNAIAMTTDNNDFSKLNFCQDLEAEVCPRF